MCNFTIAWVGKCQEEPVEGSDMCENHVNLVCDSCGAPATHDCTAPLWFVCGAPLCDNCTHSNDKMGPRHISNEEYDRQRKLTLTRNNV